MTHKKYYIVVEYNAEFNVEVLALTDDWNSARQEIKKRIAELYDEYDCYEMDEDYYGFEYKYGVTFKTKNGEEIVTYFKIEIKTLLENK